MQHLFTPLERPLPEALQEDLEALLSRDNNSFLTWVDDPDAGPEVARWFTVKLTGDGVRYGLRLELWNSVLDGRTRRRRDSTGEPVGGGVPAGRACGG